MDGAFPRIRILHPPPPLKLRKKSANHSIGRDVYSSLLLSGGGEYWGRGRKLGVLGYFRQEIECSRPKYDPKSPYSSKLGLNVHNIDLF